MICVGRELYLDEQQRQLQQLKKKEGQWIERRGEEEMKVCAICRREEEGYSA